jgi:hypothetical protein
MANIINSLHNLIGCSLFFKYCKKEYCKKPPVRKGILQPTRREYKCSVCGASKTIEYKIHKEDL